MQVAPHCRAAQATQELADGVPYIRKTCVLDDAGERTLEMAVRRRGLSARAHDRILKVARTIADLGGLEGVLAKHVAEAVQYRSLDRNYWS
jgi:magnesium chelatase family protein